MRSPLRGRHTPVGLLILLAVSSCTVRPDPHVLDSLARQAPRAFSHERYDRVLKTFVDDRGRVDYTRLSRESADLDVYFAQLSRFSPDSHPALFPDDASRLAYWLNAYNASAIVLVLDHYPIASVRDVPRPPGLFFTPRLAGFFFFHRISLGGRKTSLYSLENRIIRRRFRDPRIHFAVNCASASCPYLPRRAFRGDDLEAVLDAETREFVNDARNVSIEPERRRIRLSSVFDWYEDDFVDWPPRRHPERENTLLDYVERFLDEEGLASLDACRECEVEFIDYDWRLNAQAPGR